jgi:regulatory protein
MAMTVRQPHRPKPPLDAAKLEELAIFYVGRFATSRSKLAHYLARKLRERGWSGGPAADINGLVERLAGLGYVDDQAFALGKQRSLAARGYGERRLGQALAAAGIGEEDGAGARDAARETAAEAALRFAERRHIGPFAPRSLDRTEREKALAAMIRAGHPFSLARAIVNLEPGECADPDQLSR